jgi:hypothetical protein
MGADMNKIRFLPVTVLLFSSAMIAACGGGGGGGSNDDDVVRTGVFIDGLVEGLRYRTATRSGLTNAAGRFEYRSGETVTFSIGGIVLGSATGAAQLDPFDLVGRTPPTAELSLRLELNTRNDVTAFDRASNMAFLLFSLDNDANPDNGLDLTGWDSALADAELNFNVNLYKFARKFRRFAGAHGINSNVTPMAPLAHLYRSLGITVPINLLSGITHDFNNNTVADAVTEYAYNAAGQMTVRTFDSGVLGIIDHSKSYTYTSEGRIATKTMEQDNDENGVPNFTESYAYSYNIDGDVASEIAETGNGVSNSRSTITSAFNGLGDLVSKIEEIDADLDDNADRTLEYAYTYDADGNMLTQTVEEDYDHDSITDSRIVHTYAYDSSGNLLTWRKDEYGNDNIVDRTRLEVSTYDSAGNVLTRTVTQDSDGAGPGGVDFSESIVNTYDSKGNLATSILQRRNDGVNLSFSELTTNAYNDNGTLGISSVRDRDTDFDGEFDDRRTTSTYTYGTHGNWLTQLHRTDTNGDGVVDVTSRSEHQYTILDDGMFSLLYHYFDINVVNN